MLTVSPSTLSPLRVTTHILDQQYDEPPFPLRILARKFTAPTAAGDDFEGDAATVIIGNGVGYPSEIWIPTIKRLFALHDGSRTSVRIRSVWCVESPNTGDASELNEDVIREHHAEFFSQTFYHKCITRVIDNLLTPKERASLVAVGHSAGGGAISGPIPFNPEDPNYKPIVIGFVFVEAAWLHHHTAPVFEEMVRRVRKGAAAKQNLRWSSAAEAISELKRVTPYKRWHPEVLRVLEETAFCAAPDGGVVQKTTAANEAATFADIESAISGTERAAEMMKVIPTHLILGSRSDFWPPPLAKSNAAHNKLLGSYVKSVTVIPGAGHFIPHERPDELAEALSKAVTSLAIDSPTTRPKL